MRKKNGFSLVELLVVVTVGALIMTAGAVTYTHQLSRGRDQKRMADLGYIQTALERYKGDYGVYPGNLNEIENLGYIDKLPVDPGTGISYIYTPVKQDEVLIGCGRDITCGSSGSNYNRDYCAYILKAVLESDGEYQLCSL